MPRDVAALLELARSLAGYETRDESDRSPDASDASVATVAYVAAPLGSETSLDAPSVAYVASRPGVSVESDAHVVPESHRDIRDTSDRSPTAVAPSSVASEPARSADGAGDWAGHAEAECLGTGSDQASTWRCYVDLGSGHEQAVRPDGTVYYGTCHPGSTSEPARQMPQDEDGFIGEMHRLLDTGVLADHPPVRLGPGVVVMDVERAVRADLLSARHDNRLVREAARDRLAAVHRLVLAD